ncbi:hypothetical protein [Cellulomonas sp. HZM]|uniref:hypothetical protein n=1 Tax=Cellulomonas sp. HZM TaxID=1454010 RepID=UPI00049301CA|nr:hypothetical protein [Cellulomonas sp. HZM]
MSAPTTGLGALGVDLADRLVASGIIATVHVDPESRVQLVVQLDPHRRQVAAIRVGQWDRAWVDEGDGVGKEVVGPVLSDLCVEHAGCLSLWVWGWVLRWRGLQW